MADRRIYYCSSGPDKHCRTHTHSHQRKPPLKKHWATNAVSQLETKLWRVCMLFPCQRTSGWCLSGRLSRMDWFPAGSKVKRCVVSFILSWLMTVCSYILVLILFIPGHKQHLLSWCIQLIGLLRDFYILSSQLSESKHPCPAFWLHLFVKYLCVY